MLIKLFFGFISLLLIGFGLFLSLAISVYAAKEHDHEAFYILFATVGLIILGIYILIKTLKCRSKKIHK